MDTIDTKYNTLDIDHLYSHYGNLIEGIREMKPGDHWDIYAHGYSDEGVTATVLCDDDGQGWYVSVTAPIGELWSLVALSWAVDGDGTYGEFERLCERTFHEVRTMPNWNRVSVPGHELAMLNSLEAAIRAWVGESSWDTDVEFAETETYVSIHSSLAETPEQAASDLVHMDAVARDLANHHRVGLERRLWDALTPSEQNRVGKIIREFLGNEED